MIGFRLLKVTLSCFAVGVVASSCRQVSQNSSVKFAHASPNKMLGSPNGRLEIMRSGIKNNLGDTLNVCIQTYGKNNFSAESLILETKLAHAMWLNAAGYGSEDFRKLSFTASAKCSTTDTKWASTIVLADVQKEESGDDYSRLFSVSSMSCKQVEGNSYGCQSDKGITLGWGGAGRIGYSYFESAPNKWTSLSATSPSTVTLSPFVDWQSLTSGIDALEKTTGATKSSLKAQYEDLLAPNNQSFERLISFGDTLAQANVVLSGDSAFYEIMNASAASGEAFSGRVYRPKMGAFHTLLHEIGHTFGIKHADNPDADSITGQSGTTTFDQARNQYVTKTATMAYADQYTYLTEDDRMGMKAAAEAVRSEIASHR